VGDDRTSRAAHAIKAMLHGRAIHTAALGPHRIDRSLRLDWFFRAFRPPRRRARPKPGNVRDARGAVDRVEPFVYKRGPATSAVPR
jgi:hypothetical protein